MRIVTPSPAAFPRLNADDLSISSHIKNQ